MSKKFYTFYDSPPSELTVLDYETKFVDQSEADMCGLKYQLERYGMDSILARFEAMKDKFGFADTRLIPSFAELQNRVVKGVNYFNELPSEIRKEFGNDPVQFYEFIEKNPDQAVEKGYISNVQVKDIQNISNLNNLNNSVDKTDINKSTENVESVENVEQNS